MRPALLDPRNGPAFDTGRDGPRTFVIASTPRSGSTWLARTLWDAGVGAPKEYFNPTQLRDWEVRLGSPVSRWWHGRLRGRAVWLAGRGWSRRRVDAHWERVAWRRSQGGWFGLKLHWHHCERLLVGSARLEDVVWLRIRRADRIAQAASWAHALASGRWASHQQGTPVQYQRRRVARCLHALERHEAAWDAFLTGREVLELTYEALATEDRARALQRLGREAPVPPPALVRQGEAGPWAAAYREGR